MGPGFCSMTHLKIHGLSPKTRKKFSRALRLAGQGSQSRWLLTMINRFIRQQEAKHGDLLLALTAEEQWVVEVVASGAAEAQQIAEETGFDAEAVAELLDDLVDRGVLEIRRQGGKTDAARGARRPLYFVAPKFESNSE
jgi:hypothetical protein